MDFFYENGCFAAHLCYNGYVTSDIWSVFGAIECDAIFVKEVTKMTSPQNYKKQFEVKNEVSNFL